MMNVGKSLKIALVKQGMSQTELAKKMGVHDQWISKIANSESASQATVVGIAAALGMKASEFVALGED